MRIVQAIGQLSERPAQRGLVVGVREESLEGRALGVCVEADALIEVRRRDMDARDVALETAKQGEAFFARRKAVLRRGRDVRHMARRRE